MIGMLCTGLLVAVLAVTLAAVIVSIPDIKRYLKLRSMGGAVHEMSYCESVVEAVERRAGNR